MDRHLSDLRDAAREGDDRATAALVLALQPMVWTYCSHVGPHGDEVALVESAFLDAFAGLRERGTVDDDVEIWILQSARTACADAVRKDERRKRRAARSPWGAAPAAEEHGLRALPIERREAWALTVALGLDHTRAAAVIDASVATVKVRLMHALKTLDEPAGREASG